MSQRKLYFDMAISIPTHFLLPFDGLHDQNWPNDFRDIHLKN